MNTIIEEFKKKSDLYSERGASEKDIKSAERALDTQFASDYKEYLRYYGAVSCGGHELTGLSTDENLDVVRVTLQNRENNPSIGTSLYVVEETHIDGIVIWQSNSGEVYQSAYKEAPTKAFDSLVQYVSTFANHQE